MFHVEVEFGVEVVVVAPPSPPPCSLDGDDGTEMTGCVAPVHRSYRSFFCAVFEIALGKSRAIYTDPMSPLCAQELCQYRSYRCVEGGSVLSDVCTFSPLVFWLRRGEGGGSSCSRCPLLRGIGRVGKGFVLLLRRPERVGKGLPGVSPPSPAPLWSYNAPLWSYNYGHA